MYRIWVKTLCKTGINNLWSVALQQTRNKINGSHFATKNNLFIYNYIIYILFCFHYLISVGMRRHGNLYFRVYSIIATQKQYFVLINFYVLSLKTFDGPNLDKRGEFAFFQLFKQTFTFIYRIPFNLYEIGLRREGHRTTNKIST